MIQVVLIVAGLLVVDGVLASLAPKAGVFLTLLLMYNGALGAFTKSAVSNSQGTLSRRTIADCAAGAVIGGLYNKIVPTLGTFLSSILSGFGSFSLPQIDASWNPVEAALVVYPVGYLAAHVLVNLVDKVAAGETLLAKVGIKPIKPPQ